MGGYTIIVLKKKLNTRTNAGVRNVSFLTSIVLVSDRIFTPVLELDRRGPPLVLVHNLRMLGIRVMVRVRVRIRV